MRKASYQRQIGRIWKFLPMPVFFEVIKHGGGKFDFLKQSSLRLKDALKDNIKTDNFFDLEQEGVYYYDIFKPKLKADEELSVEKEAFWEVLKCFNFKYLFSARELSRARLLRQAVGLYMRNFKKIIHFKADSFPFFTPCIRVDFDKTVFLEEKRRFGRKDAFLKASTFKLELGENSSLCFPTPIRKERNGVVFFEAQYIEHPPFDETASIIHHSSWGVYGLIKSKNKFEAMNFLRYFVSISLFVSIFSKVLPEIFVFRSGENILLFHSLQVHEILMEDNEFYEFYVIFHFLRYFFERFYLRYGYSFGSSSDIDFEAARKLERLGISLDALLVFVEEILIQKIGIFYKLEDREGRIYLKVWDIFGKVHLDGLYNF